MTAGQAGLRGACNPLCWKLGAAAEGGAAAGGLRPHGPHGNRHPHTTSGQRPAVHRTTLTNPSSSRPQTWRPLP